MEKFRVALTAEERINLEHLVSTGKAAARRLIHARILLRADANVRDETDQTIVDAVGCSLRTVSRVRHQFVTCGLEAAIARQLQPARPDKIKIKGDIEQRVVALACSDPPEGRCRWTLRLLGDELVAMGLVKRIARETIRQALKKTTSSRGRWPCGAYRQMRMRSSSGAWRTSSRRTNCHTIRNARSSASTRRVSNCSARSGRADGLVEAGHAKLITNTNAKASAINCSSASPFKDGDTCACRNGELERIMRLLCRNSWRSNIRRLSRSGWFRTI
jgi:Homeodomain-like domain